MSDPTPPHGLEILKNMAMPRLTGRRFLYGALAGGVIALITAIVPGQTVISEFLAQTGNPEDFYNIVGSTTMQILIGMLCAPFCPWNIPYRILIFCAVTPGLVTALQNQSFSKVSPEFFQNVVNLVTSDAMASAKGGWFVSSAVAQESFNGECVEAHVLSQIGDGIANYIAPVNAENREHYGVVVFSSNSLPEAIALRDSVDGFDAYIGCRRPGNEFYPVMISSATTLQNADKIRVEYERALTPAVKPFVEYYKYRRPLDLDMITAFE